MARTTLALLLTGTSMVGCSDKSRCGDDTDCPSIEVWVDAHSAKVHFAPSPDLALSVNGVAKSHTLTGGEAVFEAIDSGCTRSCDYKVKTLYFELDRVMLSADQQHVVVEDLRLGLSGPLTVKFDDSYSIPQGTETWGCALVADEAISTRTELTQEAHLVIDLESSSFAFEGELPFEFHAIPNRECRDFALVASGFPAAATPWDQHPLCVGVDDCPLQASQE